MRLYLCLVVMVMMFAEKTTCSLRKGEMKHCGSVTLEWDRKLLEAVGEERVL